MAKYKKIYEIVIEKTVEILKQYPDGLDYSSLTARIFAELPDIQKNTVHGTFTTNFKYFPKNVVKPKRGFYIWIDANNNQLKTPKNQNQRIENDLSVINGKVLFIRLKNFQQFKDIELNLTIPEGEENAGQPLEKVCILGQSGTGKTTLLNLIRFFILSEPSKHAYHIIDIEDNAEIEIEYLIPEFAKVLISYKNSKLTYTVNERLCDLNKNDLNTKLYEILKEIEYRLIYFPSDSIKKLDTNSDNANNGKFENLMEDKVLDFDLLNPSYIWDNINIEIADYNNRLNDRSLMMSNVIIQNPNNSDKALKEFTQWLNENPNPILLLAKNCLDKFLTQFGVRVKTQLDKKENIDFITLETNEGKELKLNHWSTGTKQIVSRGMTLYQIKPQNTIILFDEPENALYPNVQKEIIDFYTQMAENTQFFFATHSPIIASSFKPYEVIELKYDKSNTFVEQVPYFKGNRHIDNYFKDPRMLRWDGLLMEMFGLQEEGNEDFREKALIELKKLEYQIENLRKKNLPESKEHDELLDKIVLLKQKLGFDYEKD